MVLLSMTGLSPSLITGGGGLGLPGPPFYFTFGMKVKIAELASMIEFLFFQHSIIDVEEQLRSKKKSHKCVHKNFLTSAY